MSEDTVLDELTYDGCPKVSDADSYYWGNSERWTVLDEYVLPLIREPLMSAYNFTEEDVEGWFYSDWQ